MERHDTAPVTGDTADRPRRPRRATPPWSWKQSCS